MTGRKIAMIIAVSDYDSSLHKLEFCKNDGLGVKKILKTLGFEIKENNAVIGSVTGHSMSDAIYDFFQDTTIRSVDTVLFYFSGHGVPDADMVYLATSDIDPNNPSKLGFSFDNLTKLMNNCISTRIVTVLDCCYSGTAKIGDDKGSEDTVVLGTKIIDRGGNQLKENGEGKCLLAASQASQKAFGMEDGGYSVFTHYLIEGLKGAKEAITPEGNVTPDSLGRYLYHKVTEVFPNQKPIRKVETSGDIILASYPDLPQGFDPESQKKIDVKITIDEANELLKNKDYSKALISYNSIIEQDQENSDAWNNKGCAYEKLMRPNEAKECFERVLEIKSNDSLTWFNKGNIFLKLREFDDALECYNSALEINSDEPDFWFNKGVALLELGKEKEGKECLKKAKNLSK